VQQVIAFINKVKDKISLVVLLGKTSYNLYLYIK